MGPCSKTDFHGYLRNFLGFSRISSTTCEFFLGICCLFRGICQVYMLDAAKSQEFVGFSGYFEYIAKDFPGICGVFG